MPARIPIETWEGSRRSRGFCVETEVKGISQEVAFVEETREETSVHVLSLDPSTSGRMLATRVAD